MATTAQIRTHIDAIAMLKLQTAKINRMRKKEKKEPLSLSQVTAIAIENLTVQQGVDK